MSQTEISTHRDLAAAEIIRQVKERFRVSRYLMVVAALWALVGALLYLFWLFLDYTNSTLQMTAFVLQAIGYFGVSIGFAVQRAVYRCPVCDGSLGRKLKDKLYCPKCNAQVKEPA